jgi:hypothetical protein
VTFIVFQALRNVEQIAKNTAAMRKSLEEIEGMLRQGAEDQ